MKKINDKIGSKFYSLPLIVRKMIKVTIVILTVGPLFTGLMFETASLLDFILKIICLMIFVFLFYDKKNTILNHINTFLFILFSLSIYLFNINVYADGSYAWVKKDNVYVKAPVVTFNPFGLNTLNKKIIVKDDSFGGDVTDDRMVKITIKKGDFDINLYAYVELSRSTWEEFNFDDQKLRDFISDDIKKRILRNFDECDVEGLTKFHINAKYDGKVMDEISLN